MSTLTSIICDWGPCSATRTVRDQPNWVHVMPSHGVSSDHVPPPHPEPLDFCSWEHLALHAQQQETVPIPLRRGDPGYYDPPRARVLDR